MPNLSSQEPLTLTALAALLRSPEAVRLAPDAEQPRAAHPLAEPAADSPALEAASLCTALAVGTGPELPAALVRRMLLLAAHRLGRAGAAAAPVVRRLLDFYNREVWPVVHEQGSLGAGHDQVPLAHLGLPLLGLGEVNYQGYRLAAADVLGLFGWEPPQLSPMLALELLSGSDFTLAYATEALERAEHLLRAAAAISSLAAMPTDLATGIGQLADVQRVLEAACHADAPTPTSLAELLPPTSAPLPDLDRALAQLTQVVAQAAVQSAQRTAALVAVPALLALPRAAASLVQLLGVAPGGELPRPAASGAAAALGARRAVELAEQLLGLELLAAAHALGSPTAPDLGPAPSPALTQAVAALGEHVTFAAHGRVLAPDLHRAARFVREHAWAQE